MHLKILAQLILSAMDCPQCCFLLQWLGQDYPRIMNTVHKKSNIYMWKYLSWIRSEQWSSNDIGVYLSAAVRNAGFVPRHKSIVHSSSQRSESLSQDAALAEFNTSSYSLILSEIWAWAWWPLNLILWASRGQIGRDKKTCVVTRVQYLARFRKATGVITCEAKQAPAAGDV